ncbi:hypothetical protein AAU61_18885 [Desulfocarbo indianensis]|nr:hypothetical protein AAU61_18885 [Desulfocarbo indianensis]
MGKAGAAVLVQVGVQGHRLPLPLPSRMRLQPAQTGKSPLSGGTSFSSYSFSASATPSFLIRSSRWASAVLRPVMSLLTPASLRRPLASRNRLAVISSQETRPSV